MLVILATMTAIVAVPSRASASTTLTKDVTVSAPPSSTFSGADSGDGWDVSFYGDRIFNVFHHGDSYQVDCHLQADGSHCDTVDGISPWPKTASSTDPASEFTTPAHASGWMDTSTGRFYGWTSRESDGSGGVICVDVTTSAPNPFCGFTALTDPGANPEGSTTAFGGRAVVGNEMYAFDPTIPAMLCFSTATQSPCEGQPYAMPTADAPLVTNGGTDHGTLAAGGKVFVHEEVWTGDGGIFTCFDPGTHSTCTGDWPQLVSDAIANTDADVGSPFPFMTSNGTVTGACLPYPGVIPCWALDGTRIDTPPELIAAIGGSDMWTEGSSLGTRVFVPTGENPGPFGSDALFCYDYATGAGCLGFPAQIDASTYLYTVTPDPVRTGCLWLNADGNDGTHSQIRTVDAYDGTPGCAGKVHITSGVVIPDSECNALGWSQVSILDPSTGMYTSASLTLTGADGTPVPDGSDLPVGDDGTVDISGLTIPDSVLFTLTFVDPTFSGSGVIVRFTWSSPNGGTCEANATRVPGPPTIDTITPDSGTGSLGVAFTPPDDQGSSAITTYRYSTDGGATWRNRTDSGGTSSPVVITRTSGVGTALADGTTYHVLLRAVNDAGTGLPSNTVNADASVPELLNAPDAAEFTTSVAGPLSPVSIAGYTDPVTIDMTTDIGSLSVVDNAGLTTYPCGTCTGASISFTGPQNAVNVALATLSLTPPGTVGTGTVHVALTRSGDDTPSKNASIAITVVLPKLAAPAPTLASTSTSSFSVSFDPVANATSYTVDLYAADGTTFLGTYPSFTSGDEITGLDPSTTYQVRVTAIGDGENYDDSPPSALAAVTTDDPPTTTTTTSTSTTTTTEAPTTTSTSTTTTTEAPTTTTTTTEAPTTTTTTTTEAPTTTSTTSTSTTTEAPTSTTTTTIPSPPPPSPCPAPRPSELIVRVRQGVYAVGDAGPQTVPSYDSSRMQLIQPIVSATATGSGGGSWSLASDGGVFTAGNARFAGSLAGRIPHGTAVGIAGTPCAHGYVIARTNGDVAAFGDAELHGSMANRPMRAPLTGIALTPSGHGYYLVGNDGGVFTFGDARFRGSLAGRPLRGGIIAIVPNGANNGYWMLGRDGGVFSMGVGFYGSLGGKRLSAPAVALLPTPTYHGYWIITADGRSYPFGDALISCTCARR